MRRNRRYKEDFEISRPLAILFAIFSLWLSLVFTHIFFVNKPIERTDAIEKSAAFDYYEEEYGRTRKGTKGGLTYVVLFFEDSEKEQIRGACMNKSLWIRLDKLEKGTELHMLINPKNDYIIELKTDEKEIINFDYAQKRLLWEGIGFLCIAIFMLLLCIYFVYKSITTKEQITKEDIKFYWDIMRKK